MRPAGLALAFIVCGLIATLLPCLAAAEESPTVMQIEEEIGQLGREWGLDMGESADAAASSSAAEGSGSGSGGGGTGSGAAIGTPPDLITFATKMQEMIAKMGSDKVDWVERLEEIRNGVVQLRIVQEKFLWSMPYRAPIRSTIFGSGWFIDPKEFSVDTGDDLLIVTNAHVAKQASSITILIPELGKEPIAGEAVGICVQRDIAIVKVKNPVEMMALYKARTGEDDIIKMRLGDSDIMNRGAPVMAVGYPLGMQSVKASVGIVSGYQQFKNSLYLSITAAINPGNSGGPLYNSQGEVVGINSAKFAKASGIAFAIPSNQLRVTLDSLYQQREFIEPELGITTSVGTANLNEYLTGLKSKGGVYVKDVMPDGLYAQAGGAAGDLLLAIDDHKIDRFGKVWMENLKDRLSTAGLLLRHEMGTDLFFHIYRADAVGKGKLIKLKTEYKMTKRPLVHFLYEPVVERPKYVTFGGFVFMALNLNLVETHMEDNPDELVRYMLPENRDDPAVIISNVVPASLAHDDGSAKKGLLVHEINGIKVKTIDQLCAAISANVDPEKFWTLTTSKTFTSFRVKQVMDYEKDSNTDSKKKTMFDGCQTAQKEALERTFLARS